ncbi:hypothetical protein J4410_00055 [Candidatus Woesearchaeota archaeon]|nr:hypothetical protein [Candidatus Woesearchaeota archaeon]
MAYQPLVAYIQGLLQKGYSQQVIEHSLLQNGYTAQMIKDAFQEISPQSAPSFHFSKKFFFALLGVFLLPLIFAMFFFFSDEEVINYTLSASTPTTTLFSGDVLSITTTFEGISEDAKGTVLLQYLLKMQDTVVLSKQEAVFAQEMQNHLFSFTLPSSLEPEQYTLQVTAKYENLFFEDSISLTISEQKVEQPPVLPSEERNETFEDCDHDGLSDSVDLDEDADGISNSEDNFICDTDNDGIPNEQDQDDDNDNVPDNQDGNPFDSTIGASGTIISTGPLCPNSCNDLDVCTQDTCVGGVCQHTPLTPCCGDNICADTETPETCPNDCAITPQGSSGSAEAVSIAAQNSEEASRLCDRVSPQEARDDCFRQIAIAATNYELCQPIEQDRTRDNCYMYFALNQQTAVCDFIIDRFIKNSCNSLR